jgi:Domain of unknown function (DUF1707)
MSTPEHRASDAEREAAADRLRTAAAEGRLDPDELEERLAAAYGARTIGELVPLTADLPVGPAAEPPRPGVLGSPHLRRRLASFLTINLACIAIWLATGADSSFWPGWVLLGTGIALMAALVRVVLGVDDDDADDTREQRR